MAEYIFDKFTDGADTYKIDYSRIPYGTINTGSTSTVFNATVDGITELSNGVCAVIRNNVVTSASGCTLNVNNLGAKPIYSSMAEATRITTTFNKNYTALFIYNTIRVSTGCWDMYYGYYTNSTYSNASLGQGIGTCSTAEATTTKAVTLSNYALTTGGVVVVSFTNAVPAGSSLNVNSKGSKPIYYRGSAITDGVIKAGDRATFIYSGSYYHLLTVDRSAKTATTDVDGLMSSADKTKLDGITSGAQPNQNAFSTVKVSNTDVQANSTTDTLELEAGTNISLTPDTTNKKITIASTVVNTDSKVSTANVINNTTYYPVVGSDTTNAESKYYDNNGFKYTGTQGTASAVGSAKLELGNSTSSGTANNKEGQLVLYGSGANATTIKAGATTTARTITFPDKNGTVALTGDFVPVSDIPIQAIIQNSEFNNRVTDGVVAGFVGMALDYVTPQMFDENIILNDETYDCADAIQDALNSSNRVYFPEGVYYISKPLLIPNHAHLWGVPAGSKIRAKPTSDGSSLFDKTNGAYLAMMNVNQSAFCIEHLEFDCNDDPTIGGLYLKRPYNRCAVRDVVVNNCSKAAIFVGDITSRGQDMNTTRSQTLVIDNCLLSGSKVNLPSAPLGYFYNSFELNIKDTKFLFSSSQMGSYAGLILDYCYDAYVRGCSFAHSRTCGVILQAKSRYCRLIGNTYENLGGYVVADSNWNNWVAPSVYPTDGGGAVPDYLSITDSKYAIGCFAGSDDIRYGTIIENFYYNVPKGLALSSGVTNMTVIGSFTPPTTTSSFNPETSKITYMPSTNMGGTITTKEYTDSSVESTYIELSNFKTYSISTTTNSNVAPWSCFGYKNISSDIPTGGGVRSISVKTTANSNPASACMIGTTLGVYSRSAGSIEVTVTFWSVHSGVNT